MSAQRERRRKAAKIRHLLETEGDAIHANTTVFNEDRYEVTAGFDEYEDLRTEARAIKEDAIERLPELVERVRESVEANGGTVYVADDAADANRYIETVVEDEDAETLVKSKSMTTEELDVNEHLESRGVDVWETDLGEFVLQVADEAPSHLVGPSLHKSRADVARLFNETFDPEEPFETPQELTEFARDYLGERIRDADVGMTGANFVLADSGTIALVTNEGNARKSAVTPDTHVAVAGLEKLIPGAEELQPFVELIAKAATGQPIAQYVTMLTPPVASPTIDFDSPDEPLGSADDREFHLVLVDNGRLDMREDDHLKETLYCIRCGACANSCGNFQHVGGHAFGGETYTGGIAGGWETGVHGLDSAEEFNDLCTGCSRCVNACPVKIDIPWINTVVRDRINRGSDDGGFDFLVEGLTPDAEPGGMDVQKRLFGNFGTLAKLGSATAPLSNAVSNLGPVRSAMDRFLGVDARRDLPEFRRETLVDWFEKRGGAAASKERATESRAERDSGAPNVAADRKVVLYPDTYTNYVLVERGKAAVRTLEALGARVELATPRESGRAPLSQGMVETATENARAVAAELDPYLDAGFDVVVVEPSDLAAFRREYEKLLDGESHERLSENAYEVMEYVYGLVENGADPGVLSSPGPDAERVAYHSHCQQRTLGVEAYTEAVLANLGYDVLSSDVECCGMAGSFGYKSEYYELSMDVGGDLREEFAGAEDRTLVASGTSCTEQMGDLFARDVTHPVELVAPDE